MNENVKRSLICMVNRSIYKKKEEKTGLSSAIKTLGKNPAKKILVEKRRFLVDEIGELERLKDRIEYGEE